MSYEVWHGTPNEMAKIASKDSLPVATKWACEHLDGVKDQAKKYDSAAVEHINSTAQDMRRLYSMQPGETRGWQFPYIAVTYRIEIRRTP